MFVAAPAAFRASDTPTNAANVVGAMLTGWHYIALLAPILLLLIEWRRGRRFVTPSVSEASGGSGAALAPPTRPDPSLSLGVTSQRAAVIAVVFAGVLFAALEVTLDLRVRAIRAASVVPITSLQRNDPVRRRFGLLHGMASLALAIQTLIAAAATIAIERDPTPTPN